MLVAYVTMITPYEEIGHVGRVTRMLREYYEETAPVECGL